MTDISTTCEHFDKPEYATRDGRRFFHGNATEAQILHAETLPMSSLLSWARGAIEYSGALGEETLIFLVSFFSRTGEAELTSDLSAVLNGRIFSRISTMYRRSLGNSAATDFAGQFCSEFWLEALNPRSSQALWLQVCFWKVVRHLAQDCLRKQLRLSRRCTSLDSDHATITFVKQLPSGDISLEDQIYLREFLDGLNHLQRTALMLRYSNASIKDIGSRVGRSSTAVKTSLHRVAKHLADAA